MIPQEFLDELAKERGISKTEVEVLNLALNGETNTAAIATRIGITPAAVRKRLSEVYREFDIPGEGPGKLAKLQQKLVSLYQERQTSSSLSYSSVLNDRPEFLSLAFDHPTFPSLSNHNELKERQEVSANPHQDWGETPESDVFYGRDKELGTLKQWIVEDRCKLVAILGMAGIGKTALVANLVAKLAKENQGKYKDEFEDVFWFSLHRTKPSINSPENIDSKISQFIDHLRQHRYLLVLDDVEAILNNGDNGVAGDYQEGYKEYGKLIRRLAEEPHQSCLILTGLEKPREVGLLERENSLVHSLQLNDLEVEEASKILKLKGLSDNHKRETLIKLYRGNPLALNIISATIKELFGGSIEEFLSYDTLVISDINDLLHQQFDRLRKLEKDVMYCLAIAQEPVLLSEIKERLFIPVSSFEVLEALKVLKQRSLIEKEGSISSFKLQPVIMQFVTNQLVEQICEEIREFIIHINDQNQVNEIQIDQIQLLRNHILFNKQTQDDTKDFQDNIIITRIKNKLRTIFRSEKLIEKKLSAILSILSKLEEQSPLEVGYASDNVRNLLKTDSK